MDLVPTRRALHGVAELLLAGPQYRATGTIRLLVTGTGFRTLREPVVAVDGDVLVVAGQRFRRTSRRAAAPGPWHGAVPGRLLGRRRRGTARPRPRRATDPVARTLRCRHPYRGHQLRPVPRRRVPARALRLRHPTERTAG